MIPSYIFVGIMILNFFFLVITKESAFSWAFRKLAGYTSEIKSVEITSPGYGSTPGSIKITKSAEWTGRGEVTLTLDLDAVRIDKNTPENIIVLFDISNSYGDKTGNQCGEACSYIANLADRVLAIEGSSFSLVTFSTDAQIIVENTTNANDVSIAMNSVVIGGSTNFYRALKKASYLLSKYYDQNIETHVILITDGGAQEDVGSDTEEYAFIKRTYKKVIVDGVQYIDKTILNDKFDLVRVTDRQYYMDNEDELEEKIFDAGLSAEYYNTLTITEEIDDTHFKLVSGTIKKDFGSASISTSGGKQILTWNLSDGKFKSGYKTKLKVKLKVKDEYLNSYDYYPTSNKTNIVASATGMSNFNVDSTLTPVLKTYYMVNYRANAPAGCSNSYVLNERHFPYENVVKNVTTLACSNSQFKGFEVSDTSVKSLGSDYFVMPDHDLVVNATWTNLQISKSFSGTVTERATLYEYLSSIAETKNFNLSNYGGSINYAEPSSDINGKGLYKISSTIYNPYPTLVYRGDIQDNNVIFNNFCWQIVRTTPTGGVKLIYNGVPSSGNCNSTGAASTIGSSNWSYANDSDNNDYQSMASLLGYMYGTVYPTQRKVIKKSYGPTWYFSSAVSYNGSRYTLSSDSLTSLTVASDFWTKFLTVQSTPRHYTCFSDGTSTCTSVYYVYASREQYDQIYFIQLTGGKTIDNAYDEMLDSSANTNNSKVKDVIDNWYANNMTSKTSLLEDTVWCNDRTARRSESGWIETGDVTRNLNFPFEYYQNLDVCNANDSFTVSSANGNGKLTYPVGLITRTEAFYAGVVKTSTSTSYLVKGVNYWTMSPYVFNNIIGYENVIKSTGIIENDNTSLGSHAELQVNEYIRPMISLKPGVYISEGDGSVSNPFKIQGD